MKNHIKVDQFEKCFISIFFRKETWLNATLKTLDRSKIPLLEISNYSLNKNYIQILLIVTEKVLFSLSFRFEKYIIPIRYDEASNDENAH